MVHGSALMEYRWIHLSPLLKLVNLVLVVLCLDCSQNVLIKSESLHSLPFPVSHVREHIEAKIEQEVKGKGIRFLSIMYCTNCHT